MESNTEISHNLNMSITTNHRMSSNINLSKPPVDELKTNDNRMFQDLSPQIVTYKECLKNHAVATGGHVIDGCAEFMLAMDGSFKCVACGCHRNFHRPTVKVPEPIAATPISNYIHVHCNSLNPPTYHHQLVPDPGSPPQYYCDGIANCAMNDHMYRSGTGKHQRTKFTEQQKKKMFELAEVVGWKIKKLSNDVLDNFCDEVGVERKDLKVWIHNNKNTYRKKVIMANVGMNVVATALTKSEMTMPVKMGL